MLVKFTKMQGAGNDFVVLDATRAALKLSPRQLKLLGDRRFGVGADQILVVEPAPDDSVEHCMQVVTDGRIRHLPVLERGQLVGLVSIGDLVKATMEEQQQQLEHLQRYIAS